MCKKEFQVTPITKVYTELPINLYVKREDLLPFSFGGNKVRIAEEFYKDMECQGKNCMVGYGNARSNLSRALANRKSDNQSCYIISPADEDGERIQTNNSRMVESFGAEIRYCTKQNVAETVETVLAEIASKGLEPYYIYGNKYGKGNEAVPVWAYYKVYDEIKKQQEEMKVKFDYIFLAVGTGMTQAGLLAGKEKRLGNENIIGISVARPKEKATESIREYLEAFGATTEARNIHVLDNFVVNGYGTYNTEISCVIREMMKTNGIALDPTYTGKAFWGMCEFIKEQKLKNKNVLFIHTGGTPLFFDFLSNKKFVHYSITKLEKTEENTKSLASYLMKQSSEFAVPLLNKIEPNSYAEKLLSNGYVFCALDQDDNIVGVIGGYANDFCSRIAYESVFVVSSQCRGTTIAKELFIEQKKYCAEIGMKSIDFTTNRKNTGAVKFYKKMNVPIETEKCNDQLIAYRVELK